MVQLPRVKLDATLADFYNLSDPGNGRPAVGQVLCGTNSGVSLSEHFARNARYLYQDSAFNKTPKGQLNDSNNKLRRSLAIKYLSLVPQRDAFICGRSPVVLFDIHKSDGDVERDRRQAERTLLVLESNQRPSLIWCSGPGNIPAKKTNVRKLAYKVALDDLAKYPLAVDLEQHWYVNSKQALATSGLPTPACNIIELTGYCPDASTCCKGCRTGGSLFVPTECTGLRGTWMDEQINNVLDRISLRSLPFVLKNQQTFGGAGTYVVTTEEECSDLLDDFSGGLLRKLFSQVTSDNYHLKPGTILLSDMVRDPISNYGLTFFVSANGDATFIGVSEQMTDCSQAWVGSTIDYARQNQLREKFWVIMHEIAGWLHKHDYYGPAGADILENRSFDESRFEQSRTEFHIVDLNARTTGSLCLPLLRSHFESRGLGFASSFSITVDQPRDRFIDQWKTAFQEGRLCILSWYEDQEEGIGVGDVAMGAEDEKTLQMQMDSLRQATIEVSSRLL